MATRTITTDIKLTGEKEFNDGMVAMNSNLKTLRSDMAAVSAEYDDNAGSVEALTAKQKILQDSVAQHQVKVDALRQKYEHVAEIYGENSAAADKYKQQLNQATVALQKETAALEKNQSALSKAQKESSQYVPITQRAANAAKEAGDKVKGMAADVADGAHHVPVLAEALDVAKVSAKGLSTAAKGAGTVIKGLGSAAGTAAGGVAKGIGAITAASAVGVAAIGAGGMLALSTMSNMAREAAEAAKTAQEAGETLTSSQEQWLAYSEQLDALDGSVANAKSALAGVLLPMLSDLSSEGTAFLNDFSRDMEAAAGDTGAQTKVLSDYIVKGATLIKDKLPEYIETGKELFSGLAEGLGESGPELLDMGLDLVMELLDGIISYAPELATAGMSLIQSLLDGLVQRGPDIFAGAVDMVVQIVSGLAQAAPQMIPAAAQLVTQLLLTLVESAPQLLDAGLELVLGIISGIASGLGEIGSAVEDIILEILEIFGGADFASAGKDVIDGIKKGISDAWDGLKSWFNNLWDSLFKNRTVDVNVNASGTDGSHAGGLDYVPFDGYIAELHRGEMVLTNAEASRYRRGYAAGAEAVQKVFNLNISTQSLTKADLDMLVEYVNGKLGDDLP